MCYACIRYDRKKAAAQSALGEQQERPRIPGAAELRCMLWSNPSYRGGILAAVFAPFKGCNPDVDFLHRGAIVDGWRASLSPHRGARERRGELVHRLCVQLRACRRRALGASPIRPTLADGRSPSSSISACSVFARLPCRIMDGRELSEGGTYEHPDIRHEEKLRY